MVVDTTTSAKSLTTTPQLSKLQLFALGLCALGFSFDLWEMGLGGVLSTIFSAQPAADSAKYLPWVVSSVYLGALIGAPLFGWAGDRVGRRAVLVGLLTLMGIASIAAALAPSLLWVIWLRGLAGMALGAFPPVMFAYLTDILPAERRGKLLVIVSAIGALGSPAAIFFVRGFADALPAGLVGWQWALLTGGIGTLLVGLAVAALPESPRWLQAVGRVEESRRAFERFRIDARIDQSATRVSAAHRTSSASRWLLMITLFFLSAWALVSFPIVSGPILLHKGFQLSDTLFYLGVAAFGPPVGSLLASLLIDRMDRRVSLALFAVLLVFATLAFALGMSPAVLMFASTAFNLIALIYIPVLYIYAAEQFRTRERSFALSVSWAFNRLGSAVAPLVLLPLLAVAGPFSVTGVMIAALLLSVVLLVTLAPAGPPGQALH